MRSNIKRALFLSCSLIGAPGMAGSSSGTGPPSKAELTQMLMEKEIGAGAGLFLNESGNTVLGVNRTLDSSFVLTRSRSAIHSLSISTEDFDRLTNSQVRAIDATMVGVPQEISKSYTVEDGENLDELILKDRRESARGSVK